jgi:hypothetical protein
MLFTLERLSLVPTEEVKKHKKKTLQIKKIFQHFFMFYSKIQDFIPT